MAEPPKLKHPKRGTPGTGKWAGYVANGNGGWITPVEREREDKLLDKMMDRFNKTGGNL